MTIPVRSAVPPAVSYRTTLGGLNSEQEVFVNTNGFTEGQDETLRAAAQLDGSDLETGLFPYRIRTTNNFSRSRISSDISGTVAVVNETNSPFGSGWGINSRTHATSSQL